MEREIRSQIEVIKFKRLILEMFLGYPNYVYFKMVDEVVSNQKSLQDLVDSKILIKGEHRDSEGNTNKGYSLGINALSLISAWESERYAKETTILTKRIEGLTICVLLLTLVMAVLTFAMVYSAFF